MIIATVSLKQFRCFASYTLECKAPIVLIEGNNGSGKTSILEALHFACYLKSFRSHAPRELIAFDQEAFFVNITGESLQQPWDIKIGCSPRKRAIKLNDTMLQSYQELITSLRIISILEQDLAFITGSPEDRRAVLDHALLIYKPELALIFKQYRRTLEQRNALLHQSYALDPILFDISTEQLWNLAATITHERKQLMVVLEKHTQQLALHIWGTSSTKNVSLQYQSKVSLLSTYKEFKEHSHTLLEYEKSSKRTLFGAHLDDIQITLQEKSSKVYASRGQQKLVVCLFKLAQCLLHNNNAILLLDDIVTDFDEYTLSKLIPLAISLAPQVVITSPCKNELLLKILEKAGKPLERILL